MDEDIEIITINNEPNIIEVKDEVEILEIVDNVEVISFDAIVIQGGGTGNPFLDNQYFEITSTFYYYGGINPNNSSWKIWKKEVGNVVNRTSATISNNPSYSDLTTAWNNKLTLNYN